jgi:hypothetical protein
MQNLGFQYISTLRLAANFIFQNHFGSTIVNLQQVAIMAEKNISYSSKAW